MRVVIDTNVIVSALINVHGTPARILDFVLLGQLIPVFDDRMISEYREVLLRPKFRFRSADVYALLELLESEGESVVAPTLSLDLPDAEDAPFIEVAIAAVCDFLITGNIGHFPDEIIDTLSLEQQLRVVTPADFLKQNHFPLASDSRNP